MKRNCDLLARYFSKLTNEKFQMKEVCYCCSKILNDKLYKLQLKDIDVNLFKDKDGILQYDNDGFSDRFKNEIQLLLNLDLHLV